MSDPEDPLTQAVTLCKTFDGVAAFYAKNLTTGEELAYHPDRVMPAASTIKILVLAELFRQVDAGLVDPDRWEPVQPEDHRGGSGILKDLTPDLSLPLRDHATLMIALSDNTSTAVLVRVLGLDRIMQSAREWDMKDTEYPFISGASDPKEYSASTPRDICRLLELIALDELSSPEASAGIREILLRQQYHDQIGRYLPYSPYGRLESRAVIRSKSGFMQGVRVDAGIIDLPSGVQYVICLMTDKSPDHTFAAEHPGSVLNGRISRIIFDAWWPSDVPRA